MMKKVIVVLVVIVVFLSSNTSYSQSLGVSVGHLAGNMLRAIFLNENVYKTKKPITLYRVYDLVNDTVIDDTTQEYILDVPAGYSYIRYKVIKDGDKPYIRILPMVGFGTAVSHTTTIATPPASTSTVTETSSGAATTVTSTPIVSSKTVTTIQPVSSVSSATLNAHNYYFQMKDDPEPNNQYLASQMIEGMPLTTPIKLRTSRKSQPELEFNIGYCFGYKIKLGNNPYSKEKEIKITFRLMKFREEFFGGQFYIEDGCVQYCRFRIDYKKME